MSPDGHRQARWAGLLTFATIVGSLLGGVPAAAQNTDAPQDIRWMATGDSYSSGEGVWGNEGDCAHSDQAWGPKAASLLGDSHGWGIRQPVTFTACTGHLVGDFYIRRGTDKGAFWTWAQEQTGQTDPRFDVITLTFGGNDLGFVDTLIDCAAPAGAGGLPDVTWSGLLPEVNADTGCDITENDLMDKVTALTEPKRFQIDKDVDDGGTFGARTGSLADFYATLAERHLTGDGKLVVVGYPRLFAPSGEWKLRYGVRCATMPRGDANMLGRVTEYLDTVIHQQVNRANEQLGDDRVLFVSAVDLFGGREGNRRADDGHELCGNGADWLNGLTITRDGDIDGLQMSLELRYMGSFHPHADGHDGIARAVTDLLADQQWDLPPPRPQLPDGWRWLEVPGAAIGVPGDLRDDSTGHLPFPDATAAASAPQANLYTVTVSPLTAWEPASQSQVAVADIDAYRDHIAQLYATDPELEGINGGLPQFETMGTTTAGLDIVGTSQWSGSGDVLAYERLVELPDGGVVRFEVSVYVEDVDGPYGSIPFERYQDTIWVDPAAWRGPTDVYDGPWAHPLDNDMPLHMRGVGTVEAGMTLAEAEAVTGQQWMVEEFDTFDGRCFYAAPAGINAYSFMVHGDGTGQPAHQGRIARVTTSRYSEGGPAATLSGIRPGSTIEEVRAVHGDALVESRHEYELDGSYLDLLGQRDDAGYGVRFEVDDSGTVGAIHAGDAGAIRYVEGCA